MEENFLYTLTYSASSKGWPSFYSYYPEIIKGMNQFMYSFKGGNLYEHNTNEVRNNFYGEQGVSTLTSIFNDVPTENKKFKTISLEGDDAWTGTFITDQQTTGFINYSEFEKKEGDWFSYIRNEGSVPANADQYPLRSLTGIGVSDSIQVGLVDAEITFIPPTIVDSMLSIGDAFYFGVEVLGVIQPSLAGIVTSVVLSNDGTSKVIINTFVPGAGPIPSDNEYFLYIKNSIAESQGVMGHFCEFTLTNDNTSATELFVVKSQAFKSFP